MEYGQSNAPLETFWFDYEYEFGNEHNFLRLVSI